MKKTIITILLTALIVGGGFYYWQSTQKTDLLPDDYKTADIKVNDQTEPEENLVEDSQTDEQEAENTLPVNNTIACTKEGESLGAVVPSNAGAYCCEGLVPYIENKNIVGTMGVCVKKEVADQNNNQEQLIGGDSDEHGCKGSAGYSWCEAKQKCLRTWEESCQ